MFPFFPVPMDVATQAHVQVRAEERVRTGTDVTAEESEVNPQLRGDLIWKNGNDHFVAIYQPRFIHTHTFSRELPDSRIVNPATLNTSDPNDNPFSLLHNAGLGYEMLRPRYRLSLYQFFAYGPVTTTALLVQPAWGGDGTPADPNPLIPSTVAARFTLLFAQTQLFVPIRLSRRVALTPGFVFNAFGGADDTARGAMALTYGPGATLALEVAATKSDRFISTIGAGRVDVLFQNDRTGATIYRAEANQAWRHNWSRSISTGLLGGGTIGGDQINGFAIYSVAQADILYDSYGLAVLEPGAPPQGGPPGHGNHFQVGAAARVQPWLDLFSGELEQRVVGTVAANQTIQRVTIRGQVSTARVFNTPRSVAKYATFQAEGGLRYAFLPVLTGDVGLRFGFQDFSNAIRFNELTQTTVFGSLTYTPLPARF